jgi:predicted dehydrogenase
VKADQAAIGVVGAGRWGRNLIRVFGNLERARVLAVCDTDPEKLAVLSLPSGARPTGDLAAILDDPAVDAVVIATPPSAHAAHALLALAAGKHVFVEKPMALTLGDACRMRDAARRARRQLMVGHLLRYHPAVSELDELIHSERLGKIERVVALRLGPRATTNEEGPWWSLAPHDLSLVRRICRSEILAVTASRSDFGAGASTVSARLRLSSGSASLLVSTAGHAKTRRFIVFGRRKTAVFDDGGETPTLTLFEASGSPDAGSPSNALYAEGVLPLGRADLGESEAVRLVREEPLHREAVHFVDALLGGCRISTDADEGCSVTAALEAGNTSFVEGGRWVRVAAAPGPRAQQDEQEHSR